MSLPRLPLTKALALLVQIGTERPCGIGEFPKAADGQAATFPYSVLYSLPGDFSGPALFDWHADAAWTYQVTSVGTRDDQVQWLADRVRSVLVERSDGGWRHGLKVPNMVVTDRELTADVGTAPVDGSQGDIVSYAQRFTITVSPARSSC
ncbi:hypothetical protein RCO28_30980 [Streptomyces sp. LHD-70]|uniref:hypothetical protein n=1 Tax=Streptomyces sp. LHD-70 TaxID=3072140 RepID=UPI00280DC8F1|nr:hypothetical protein [Streptomyces sp. LHD-70]MDQ8706862.1 hypothetical protein [Streptomyces sp. LHD-70]